MFALVLAGSLSAAVPCAPDVDARLTAAAAALGRARLDVEKDVPKKKRAAVLQSLDEAGRALEEARAAICPAAAKPQAPRPPKDVPLLDEATLAVIIAHAHEQDGDDGKAAAVEEGVRAQCVTVQQARQLLALFAFDGEKLRTVRFLVPRLVDRADAAVLADAFAFAADKKKVEQLLKTAPTAPQCAGG